MKLAGAPPVNAAPRPPGALAIHPLTLAALVLLLVNDHILKQHFPSALTGKLSDFAGVLLLPILLQALAELAFSHVRRRIPSARLANRILLMAVLATLLGFTLPELWKPAETLYRFTLGALQWPVYGLHAALEGDALPAVRPVRATADATDLAALPMALVALALAWQPRPRATVLFGALVGIALSTISTDARAQGGAKHDRGVRTHDGFFAAGELGVGAMLISSKASIVNGFQQPVSSSARDFAAPWVSLAMGGTLREPRVVLGGRLSLAQSRAPVVSTLEQTFQAQGLALEFMEVAAFARFYPNATGGLSVGAAVGIVSLRAGGHSSRSEISHFGDEQEGVSISGEGGYSFWISPQFSAGGTLRLMAARTDGQHGSSTLFAPALLASLVWH